MDTRSPGRSSVLSMGLHFRFLYVCNKMTFTDQERDVRSNFPDIHVPRRHSYLNHVRLVAHFPDFSHVAQLLLHQRGLEGDQHEQSEHAVVPVLVQTPKANTEHLENEERCSGSFSEQLHELRNVHLHAEIKGSTFKLDDRAPSYYPRHMLQGGDND